MPTHCDTHPKTSTRLHLLEYGQSAASVCGINLSQETAKALSMIVDNAGEVSTLMNEIAAASSEQAEGADQVAQAISQIDEVTNKNSTNASECSEAANKLTNLSNSLTNLIKQFRLK